MLWASAISRAAGLPDAVEEAVSGLRPSLHGSTPDLLLVFASPRAGEDLARTVDLLHPAFPGTPVVGCSGGGIIGDGVEVERGPGLSVSAAVLPGVSVTPFHVDQLPPPGQPPLWRAAFGEPSAAAGTLLLADPFSCDAQKLIEGLDAAYPHVPKIGGLASGGQGPGEHVLFDGVRAHRTGVVGVQLGGNIKLEALVAQGCRPVGAPLFVTRAEGNVIHGLDGRAPADVLQDLFEGASEPDRKLMRHSLFLGMTMDGKQETYRQGDFLIRNLMGLDGRSGSLAVGATLDTGDVIQFHVRDARTSADDLKSLVRQHEPGPAAVLLFSCLGRGRGLYGQPNHDSAAIAAHLGDMPIAGFFCNGEIGPVQGQTFLHGYTSSCAVVRPRTLN